MLKNFFVITFRSLLKNGAYSAINIAGLAIGITSSILILLWVEDETSYDKFLPKYERLYQVWVNATFDGEINSWNSVPLPTYEAMKSADASILNSCVTGWGSTHLLRWNDTRMNRPGYMVSKEFLEMFEYTLVQGNAATVLDDPYSIVLRESLAKEMFGNEDPVGKSIRFDDRHDLKVTGIVKDKPDNSFFQFDYLVPWEFRALTVEWVKNNADNWGNYSFQIFIELDDPADEKAVEASIKPLLRDNGQTDMQEEFFLHPMKDWRLYSDFENGVPSGGRVQYVNLFSGIAILILLIACINFMNLATARSERRAKEVGIRKTVGSRRYQLIIQFLGESLIITFIAFLFAITLSWLLLPFYNQLVDKELSLHLLSSRFWMAAFALVFLIGIISGSYPAFFLSGFKPVAVLKGKITVGTNAVTPRKIMVVLQFGFAIFLITGTIMLYKQIQLVQNRELGYEQNNLISVELNEDLSKNYKPLKLELEQSGAVASVTKSNSRITSVNSNNFLSWPGKPEDVRIIFATIVVDYDYTRTMGIKLLEGRDFNEDYAQDSSAIMVNKAALDIMNLEDPIGTHLDLWDNKRELIGIVDNVLMESVHEEVRPTFFVLDDWGGNITLRLQGNNVKASLEKVQDIFTKHDPAHPFEYTFVDEDYAAKFENINLTSRLALIFAVLSVAITGLGLFGLASFTAEQRTHEIGIRKVLGAPLGHLIALISREFAILVLIAFVISAPIAWYLLNEYLERYVIRVEMQWWVFPLTGLIALLFALLIVANQAYGAAMSDPVKAIRSDK